MNYRAYLIAGAVAVLAASTPASAVTLVSGQCFAANTAQGCKFDGIITGQPAADQLESLYNGLHPDIELQLLDKLDAEGGPLMGFLTNAVFKDGDPNELMSATFTNSAWIIDYYAVKAGGGTQAVLYAVGTPGSSFNFSSYSRQAVSHLVLFGRQVNNPNVVPEPATWAMMLGGFGLIGGAMRRRTTKVVFA
jgi:hypothetical protein